MGTASRRLPFWTVVLAAMAMGVVPLPGVELAVAANRDLAIYRETAATDAITSANFDHDWDTTVREDTASINLNGDSKSIELQSGHYLVLYGSRFDATGGTNRSEIQTQLRLAGLDLPIGWSQGYIRRTGGADEAFTSGGGIINAVSNGDALILRSFRTDANSGAGVQRTANASGIQVLKIDDTWDYARLNRTTTQVGPTSATYLAVQYDSQDELNTGSFDHSTSVNPEDITLKPAGHYLVFANTYGTIGPTSSDRTLVNQKLTLNGIDIDGTLTTVYMRGQVNGNHTMEGAASIGTIIETTAANQILNVEVSRGDGTAAFTINQDDAGAIVQRTAITIVKLPDGADYIRLSDSGTDNINPASLTPMGWDTEDELDTASFTHPATDSRIEVNYGGEYLLLSSLYAGTAGVARAVYSQGWTKNGGALIQYGQTGGYNRNSGANDVGNWSGFIADDLVAGDYIEVGVQAIGNSGTVAADVKGIQGVRLASLLPRPVSEMPADTATLGDTTGLGIGLPRTYSASLADRSGLDLGAPRSSAATVSDSFALSQRVFQAGALPDNGSARDSSENGDSEHIDDEIDGWFDNGRFFDQSNVSSSEFSDQHLGGATFGRISNQGGLIVELVNAEDPAIGIRALVSGQGETATLVLCDDQFRLNLTGGDTVLMTCGSLTVTVLTGQAEVDLAPMLVVTLSSGSTSKVTNLGNGRFSAENLGASGLVTAVENGSLVHIGVGERVEMGQAAPVPPSTPESSIGQPPAPTPLEDTELDDPAPPAPESSETTGPAPSEIISDGPILTPSWTQPSNPTPLPQSNAASDPAVGTSFPPLPGFGPPGLVGAIALGTLTGAAFIAILITLIGLVRGRRLAAAPKEVR